MYQQRKLKKIVNHQKSQAISRKVAKQSSKAGGGNALTLVRCPYPPARGGKQPGFLLFFSFEIV